MNTSWYCLGLGDVSKKRERRVDDPLEDLSKTLQLGCPVEAARIKGAVLHWNGLYKPWKGEGVLRNMWELYRPMCQFVGECECHFF